jgi:predicted ester cyclase
MTEEQNKAVARRFFEEVWNQGKEDVIDEIFAPTVVFNGEAITREALKRGLAGRRAAFSDIHVTVEDQVAEGEKVSTRRTWRATHRGPYRGVAPTGKQVTWMQISVVRILQQLGALSS